MATKIDFTKLEDGSYSTLIINDIDDAETIVKIIGRNGYRVNLRPVPDE